MSANDADAGAGRDAVRGGRALGDGGWLGLAPAADVEGRWELSVAPHLCGRTGYFHGGCSLGAATTAMEAATGRPLVWATAQYLARAAVGEKVAFDVTIDSAGNRVSQARATSSVGDRVVAHYVGAFGQRPGAATHGWGVTPAVPGPADCGPYELSWEPEGSFHRVVDLRVAAVDAVAGQAAFWVRMPEGVHSTSAGLAMLGDYVPAGFRLALGETEAMAASLDNTVRVVAVEETDWLLLEVRLGAVNDGAAHGDLRAWAQGGRLLALASQSFTFNPGGTSQATDRP